MKILKGATKSQKILSPHKQKIIIIRGMSEGVRKRYMDMTSKNTCLYDSFYDDKYTQAKYTLHEEQNKDSNNNNTSQQFHIFYR